MIMLVFMGFSIGIAALTIWTCSLGVQTSAKALKRVDAISAHNKTQADNLAVYERALKNGEMPGAL